MPKPSPCLSLSLRRRALLVAAGALLSAMGASCADLDAESSAEGSSALRTLSSEAIYGNDDRQEVYAHPDATLRGLAQGAVVALIYPDSLNVSNPNSVRPTGPTLAQSYNLCSGQRFRDQIAAAHCSGTLIDDDLVLTAGHCVETLADCQSKYFVFNDYYASANTPAVITSQDVFTCQRIVVRSSDPDYAIVQLSRSAAPRFTPAPVKAGDTALATNQPVGIIGFGSGIPAKIDSGGVVTNPRASTRDHFSATTDSFGGNSGSGVFDASGQVVGILVAGATDYTPTSSGCWIAATYPNSGSGGGETVTYVQNAVSALCASGWTSPRLCGGGTTTQAWCQSCAAATPCPTGWSCFSWQGSSVSFCSKRCATSADCRSDHVCDPSGDCIPTRNNVCSNGDVWSRDSCGRDIALQTDCTATQTCQSATCVSTCTNACTQGARRCVTGGFQVCGASASGCTDWGATQTCPSGEACSGGGVCTANAEAWCQSCASTPCPTSPTPWACFQWSGTTSTFCAKPCASDTDCRADHSCVDTGAGLYCAPNVDSVCQGGDVYAQDTCGNSLGLDQACTATQTCDNGACTNTCANTCTQGARRCVTGGFQQCALNAQGCYGWSATQTCPTGEACQGSGTCVAPDAWCDSCQRSTDCPTGWSCFTWRDTAISFCSKPCASDADCRADYRCDPANDCIPRRQSGCYGGDVWDMDSCGNPVYAQTTCAAGQVCQGSACVAGCSDQCALGARRCVTGGGYQVCQAGTGGCAVWGATQSCGAGQVCQGSGTCSVSAQAWCQPCQARSECPTGWSCYAWQGSGDGGFCSKPCLSDGDCRADHVCDTGVCLPRQTDACYSGDVWRVDACANPVSLVSDCADLACEGTACVAGPTDTSGGEDTSTADTSGGEDTATSADTSGGEDTSTADTLGGEDTATSADGVSADTSTTTADTATASPDTGAVTDATSETESVIAQSAADDCACQVRAAQPSPWGGRGWVWLVGAAAALGMRRRARRGASATSRQQPSQDEVV
jgi:hypothetical protein